RRGEKLHEVLLASGEDDVRPAHPLISHVAVPPLDPIHARDIDLSAGHQPLVRHLAQLAGTRHMDAEQVGRGSPA
ncbi:MAG: polysaccharide biosynthesis protein, partial [Actinomycetota bacterium]|nr:polysaccharide biosynthesis protein [Actinomycetota bacterium]